MAQRRSVEVSDDEGDAFLGSSSPTKRSSRKSGRGASGAGAGGKIGEIMVKALPIIFKIDDAVELIIEKASPLVTKAGKAYNKAYKLAEPYGPDQIIKMLTGLGMMFFGGFFITTVAVFEATDQGGRAALKANLGKLSEQFKRVREANEKDDELDEDGDGIADVDQISKAELTSRKFMVFVRSCDPNVVSEALGNLYTILMAVTATLQVKFARAISLGASIGNVLAKTTLKFIVPPLKEVMSEDLHKWVPPVATYICRVIGVSIAFSVNRVLSTVHTAIRGARLATDGFTEWCEARNLNYLSDGYLDDAFAFLLAALGVWGQLFVWHRLPFLIKLMMFPFTFSEWVLSFLVSLQVSRGTATAGQNTAFQGGQGAGFQGMPPGK